MVEHDLAASRSRVTPLVTDAVREAGETVLREARRRFIEFGGGQRKFVASANGMQAGVVTGVSAAFASVGQTLPRAKVVERRRPLWSLLQYEEGLGPALDNEEPVIAEKIADAPLLALAEYGF